MKNYLRIPFLLLLPVLISCGLNFSENDQQIVNDSLIDSISDTTQSVNADSLHGMDVDIVTKKFSGTYPADSIIYFSKTLMGIPYKYASSDPAQGFDCSGFITYVYNHFGIEVPRSSIDFTNKGKDVAIHQAQPGDLILFTGTDSTETAVGHMGIVIDNSDSLRFIHSSSGKANGVTITPLNSYYQKRFVKVISIKDGL